MTGYYGEADKDNWTDEYRVEELEKELRSREREADWSRQYIVRLEQRIVELHHIINKLHEEMIKSQ